MINITTTISPSILHVCCTIASRSTVVVFLLLAALLLLNYILFTVLLYKHDDQFSSSYFIILRGMAPCDINIIVYMMFSVAAKHYPSLSSVHNLVDYINMINFGIGYFANLYLNILLAFNRLFTMMFLITVEDMFTKQRTRCIVFGSYVLAVLWEIIFFHFDFLLINARLVFAATTIMALMFESVIYIVCVSATLGRLQEMSRNIRPKFMRETKLMLMGSILAVTQVTQEILFQATGGGLAYNYAYLIHGAISPILCLIFCKRFRNVYFNAFVWKKNVIVPHYITTNATPVP